MRSKVLAGIALLLVLSSSIFAASTAINGSFHDFPIVKVKVNGVTLEPPVPGVNFFGSTLVPVRAIAEALGGTVSWDGATMTASIEAPDVSALRAENDRLKAELAALKGTSSSPAPAGGELAVHFIDVGQGDAILLQAPTGRNILVDAGPDQAVADYLKAQKVSTIDAFVVTHPHADHIGGALAVLKGFSVKWLFDVGVNHTTSVYESFLTEALAQVKSGSLKYSKIRTGNTLPIDSALEIKVLSPSDPLPDDINECSAVLKVTYGKTSFLLAGDVDIKIESGLVNQGGLAAQVLKVPHHGSAYGSSQAFLNAVSPSVSVISVGAGNSYGHPAAATLDRLQAKGTVYRTDLNGTVVITSDGTQVKAETQKTATAPRAPPAPSTPTPPPAPVVSGSSAPSANGPFVGSVNSDVYHFPYCSSAKRIKATNLVTFPTSQTARARGDRPSQICNPP